MTVPACDKMGNSEHTGPLSPEQVPLHPMASPGARHRNVALAVNPHSQITCPQHQKGPTCQSFSEQKIPPLPGPQAGQEQAVLTPHMQP